MSSWKRLRTAATTAAWMATLGVSPLLACPVCFRIEAGPVSDGVRAAVFVMLGVTVGVLSGFGFFISRFVGRLGQRSQATELGSGSEPGVPTGRAVGLP